MAKVGRVDKVPVGTVAAEATGADGDVDERLVRLARFFDHFKAAAVLLAQCTAQNLPDP